MFEFVNCELIEQGIGNEFNTSLGKIKLDEYYETWENSLKIKLAQQLDAVRLMKEHKKKSKQKWIWNYMKIEFLFMKKI